MSKESKLDTWQKYQTKATSIAVGSWDHAWDGPPYPAIPQTFVTSLGYDVELPVARALVVLNIGRETTTSSGFHTKLYGGKWMLVLWRRFFGLPEPNQAVFTAAKKTGMDIKVREHGPTKIYDIILPNVGPDEIEKATRAFDSFGKEYAKARKISKKVGYLWGQH